MATHSSILGEPQDGGAWWAAVHGVAQSRTRLKRLSSGSSTLLLLGRVFCMYLLDLVGLLCCLGSLFPYLASTWFSIHY